MAKKVLGIVAVVLLVGAIIGGGAYLLLRDSGNGSGGNRYGQNRETAAGARGGRWSGATEGLNSGTRGGRWNGATEGLNSGARGGRWNGATEGLNSGAHGGRWNDGTEGLNSGAHGGRWNDGTEGLNSGARGGGYRGGTAAADSPSTGAQAAVAQEEWLTVSGVVVAMEDDMVVRAADGTEFAFNLGPSWYGESQGVAIAVGDEVRVSAFYEDGELKAGTVERLSSGQVLALRSESGRPLWSGRGRRGQ